MPHGLVFCKFPHENLFGISMQSALLMFGEKEVQMRKAITVHSTMLNVLVCILLPAVSLHTSAEQLLAMGCVNQTHARYLHGSSKPVPLLVISNTDIRESIRA